MQVVFYNTTSDNRVVNKKLTTLKSDVIIQNQPVDRIKPIFKVAYDNNLLSCNYCYIDTFQRYYYIDTVESEGQMLNITCDKCDVLMSFKSYLYECNLTVERQSNRFNTLLPDDEVDLYSNSIYEVVKFPGAFRTAESYILLVNGGI